MAEPAEQLVGRTAELEVLDQVLAEFPRGRSRALEIVGEPGIGKTRLLTELGARADARGYLVLSGSASELERELPFGVFVDALDEYVAGLEPRFLESIEEDALKELPNVLPSLPASNRPAATLQIERYRTHRAVRGLLKALAARKPVVLVLDDLHWTDSGSIELLGALLRRPPDAPVLLAVAVRPRQVPERLSFALERAGGAGSLRRLDLGALDRDAVRALVGADADALYAQSGGNPFYLQQLRRFPEARTMAAALAEELATLGAPERRVLEGAAVAGDPFEPDIAAAAAGVPEQSAVEALDELLRLDLVRPTDVPRRFRFRHPLVRTAIYEATPGGWRLGAHERSAEALAARGAPAAARAHHVEHAARHGDAAAIAVLRDAGEEIAQRMPAGAARWFAASLRLLPATAAPQERVALLARLAGAHAATGRLEDARAALLECIRIAPAGRERLASTCAVIERALGRHAEARARLHDTLEQLPDPTSPVAAGLMVDLAIDAALGQDYERCRAWGDRALAIASPLGDAPLIAAAAGICALALAFAGASEDAERYREQGVRLVDAMPDRELASRLDAIAGLASAEGYLDRFEDCLAHAERGLAVGRATGQGQLLPVLVPTAAGALCALGRLTEGAELLEGAIEGARLAGNAQPLAWCLLSMGINRLVAGDLDAALACARESVSLSDRVDASSVSANAHAMLGFVLIECGEPERGVETLFAAAGADDLPIVPAPWRAWGLDRLAQGRLALGRGEDAERAASGAEAIAAATGLAFAAAAARRARARIALAGGDAAAAAEHALASAASADSVGARVEASVSRLLAGQALVNSGERDRAAAELQRAAAGFDECGAPRRRDEAERELGKLGRRPHRRTSAGTADSGIASLTERELQIARLIVDRRTNPQIAAELFLSRKTVETHVRNLFHKLDVSSRVDVARAVERADRAG